MANLTVCQKEDLLHDKTNKCCYLDMETDLCEITNYMIVFYGRDVEYENNFNNKYRNDISFIVRGGYSPKINPSDKLSIRSGSKIKIYYESPIETLENFFDTNFDEKAEGIVSIDLSHFDSTKITNMNNMFSGLSSLNSIDFTDFNSSKVTSMNHLFFGCKNLKSINLTNFDTSSVTDMSYMFSSCSSL